MSSDTPLVEVRDLKKYFWENDALLDRLLGDEPVAVKAVDGVSFDIHRGETLGLVGESGCGKSTTGKTLLRLEEATGGTVRFALDNEDGGPAEQDRPDVFEMDNETLRSFRRNAQILFQDPFSSLDPRITIGETVRQPLDVHDVGTLEERNERVRSLLERVGLSAGQFDRYPHEFSGGQRQRIGIARALALNPDFIVLDEPTSALDVSVQAQILNLLAELQTEFNLTYLLISHDLSVIRHISDRVAVMYLGELVEIGPATTVFETPTHPYTTALLESIPRASVTERNREVDALTGDVPSPRDPPSGCRFRTRCPVVIPPDDDIDQDVFRSIMDVRQRIERRSIDVRAIWDEVADGHPEDKSGLRTDADEDYQTRHADAIADALGEQLLDRDLPAPHDRRLREAFERLATDEWDAAAEYLREHYESVCETVSPQLPDTDHPAACHRRPQPSDVEEAQLEFTNQ